MTFNVGSLAASLQIEGMGQFENDLQRAGNALDRAGQRGASFGKLGAAAVRNAAGATVNLTAAAGAYLTILTRTGVEYNSLQQNSRAALSTLLGGAEAANAQMDKLDAFAKNSPFSKSVFIGAQQQLISFGVEAKKVVPYLDAIQNAVAGAGGSNADIEGIVEVLAKIKSSAKITAEDLNMLGGRGVNAAELIGQQMGKTGQEIRESITEGTLGADEALDALTAGMSAKFGGATAKIKEQWTGATDRIKAAQRDIGAAIAEPFVSKNGGGMAVMWGNQVADVLRAIEKQAVPVMDILTNRGTPVFGAITQGLDSAQRAVQSFDPSKIELFMDKIGTYAPAIGLTAGALGAMGASVGPLGALFGMLGFKIHPVLGAFVGLAAASPELRSGLSEVMDATRPLGPVMADIAKVMSGTLSAAMPIVADGLSLVAGGAELLVGLLEKIPAPLIAGAGAFLLLRSATKGLDLGPLNDMVSGLFESLGNSDAIRAFNAGLSPTSALLAGVGQAGEAAKAGVVGLGDALKTAFLSNPVGLALTAVSVAISVWAMANADAQAKVQEHKNRVAELRGTLDETTAALTESSRAMVAESVASEDMASKLKEVGVSSQSFVRGLMDGGVAAQNFQQEMVKAAESSDRVNETHIKGAQDMADRLGVSYETVVGHLLGFGEATEEVDKAVRMSGQFYSDNATRLHNLEGTWKGAINTQRDVVSAYEEQRVAIADAQAEQHRLNEAIANARSAMSDAGRATEDYAAATSTATDQTASLEERVRALKTAYDILTGGASSAAEANARVDASNLALAEGFAKVDENGASMWRSSISMAEEATNYVDTSTRYGQELFRALQDQQNSTLEASIVARDTAINNGQSASEAFDAARAAAEQYNSGLSDALTQAGLVGEEHKKLYDAWAIQPDVAAFTVTDNGTIDEVTLQALQLAAQIEATPDKTITISEPLSPAVRQRLQDLGLTIENIPGSKDIKVTQTGAEAADSVISNAARDRTSTISVRQLITMEEWKGVPYKMPGSATGNLFSGGEAQAFATGGFASGFYKAPPGMAAIHKFAESELPWEAYISPKPGFEDRNVKIAMDALERLGHPVVPLSALKGIPGFATGRMVDVTPSSAPPMAIGRQPVPRTRQSRGPLAGTINIGVDASYNDLLNLASAMDKFVRDN